MPTKIESNILSRLIHNEPWQVTVELQQSLTDIANQPLTASVEKNEELQQNISTAIYCGSLDEIYGGLILDNHFDLLSTSKKAKYFFRPLKINLALCRILYSSGRVFYDGELITAADKTLSFLCHSYVHPAKLTDSQEEVQLKQMGEEIYFLADLECVFTEDEIEKYLSAKEIELLASICGGKTDKNKFIYSRKHSLKDASEKISMHIKEAQIVEHAIHNKLLKYSTTKPKMKSALKHIEHNISFHNSNNKRLNETYQMDWFENNCTLIEVIVESQSFSKNLEKLKVAIELYNFLEEYIHEQEDISYNHYLNFICAGINLLSIDFNQVFLSRIFKLIESAFNLKIDSSRKNDQASKDKVNYQESFITVFLQSLNANSIISGTLLSQQISIMNMVEKLSFENNYKDSFKFIFVNKSNVDHEQQVTLLHSKYNAFQKVFLYG